MLELLLQESWKCMRKMNRRFFYFIVNIDIMSTKQRKIILKFLKESKIKVIYVQLSTAKAFNGVRYKKKRRI